MSSIEIPICQCPLCQQGDEHPDRERHRQLLIVFSRLNENQRRWFVALEAKRLGRGGTRLMAQVTGLDEKTIRRGRAELDGSLHELPDERMRRAGGGRPALEKKSQRS